MIYTVTLNPSLDYTMRLPALISGEVNRALPEEVTAGGKGINVSATPAGLGVRSRAPGFAAGFLAALEKKPDDYEYALSFANKTAAAKAAGAVDK